MKNKFSIIHATLSEALAGPLAGPAWGRETVLVEEQLPGPNGHIWWVAAANFGALLDAPALKDLHERDLLANEGKPVNKRFGRVQRKAYGILVSKLRQASRDVELRAAEVQILRRQTKELENQLQEARRANANALQVEQLLDSLRSAFKVKPHNPDFKFKRARAQKGKANAGVPTLFCSDWHVGEVVSAARTHNLNEYNLDIFRERSKRVFQTTQEVLFHHQSGMSYEAMVIALGGDMFSGIIHEELRATNEMPIHECLLELTQVLADAIIGVADEFPGVYVPAVAGNHGRIDLKPTSKNAAVDNYDYLLYRMVEMMVRARMGSKCNVDFDISPALDLTYSVYGTRYLLTHGDQSQTSTNSAEFWPSMMRLAALKQERSKMGRAGNFDYLLTGHFHKYGTVGNIIVNGSLKGYCEHAYRRNYAVEPPIQAMWITHPEHGITSHIPIYGDEPVRDQRAIAPPITSSRGLLARR